MKNEPLLFSRICACTIIIQSAELLPFTLQSARSVHSLHRPYENAEPVGIRPIAKRFSMDGCHNSSAC